MYVQRRFGGMWTVLTFVLITAVLVPGFLFPADGSAQAASDSEPIVIGVHLPLSGFTSLAGEEMLRGMQFGVEEWNAKGGVLGRRVELHVQDDASSPVQGMSIVRRFIEHHKFPVIMGPYNSHVAMATIPLAREARVPVFLGGAAATDVLRSGATEGDPWAFRTWLDTEQQSSALGRYVVEKRGLKRIAILYENTDYGRGLAEGFQRIVVPLGAEIVAMDGYEAGTVDFSTHITRLRRIRPDALYLAGLVAEGAQIAQTAYAMGFRTVLLGSGGMVSDKMFELADLEALQGMLISSNYEPETPNQVGRQFAEGFHARFGYWPGTHEADGYDAARIVLDAIERAGTYEDPVAIRDAIRTSRIHSALGPDGNIVNFDGWGQHTYPQPIAEVQGGRRVIIDFQEP